jgi:hypothetical protein
MPNRVYCLTPALLASAGLLLLNSLTVAPAAASHLRADPSPTSSAAGDTASVVIDYGDGRMRTEHVPVTVGMTGESLLTKSGAAVAEKDGAVCAIDGVGCPVGNCFCGCADLADCHYWAYFHQAADGSWTYAEKGAAEYAIAAGMTDGWAWGPGAARPPGAPTAAAASNATPPLATATIGSAPPMAAGTVSATLEVATANPTIPVATASPTVPPLTTAPSNGNLVGYAAFALVLIVLGVTIAWLRRGRTGETGGTS